MKKIRFIFLNALILCCIPALSVSAAEPQKPVTPPAPAKAISAARAVQAQSKAQTATAAAAVPAQGKNQSAPAAATKASVPAQTKPAPAAVPPVPAKPAAGANAPTAVAQPAAAPNAAATPVEIYSYTPSGKPDPFRPLVVPETVEQKKAKTEKKAPPPSIFPLQRAEADNYKVVGIAGDENHRVAIAEDSAKKFYPLSIGTRIGLRNGKVVEIMADRVIVEEYMGKKTRRVILKLRKN